MVASADWEEIYRLPTLFHRDCWKECDSYCCTTGKTFSCFSFIGKKGQDLYLFPGEMEFLRRENKLQQGFAESYAAYDIHLLNDATVKLDKVICNLKGQCTFHEFRPAICRFYPIFPVVGAEGRINAIEPFALVDYLRTDVLQKPPICAIDNVSFKELDHLLRFFSLIFTDPLNIFLLIAASRYKRHIKEIIFTKFPALVAEEEQDFFKKWERLYLFGKLVDKPQLLAELTGIYEEVMRQGATT